VSRPTEHTWIRSGASLDAPDGFEGCPAHRCLHCGAEAWIYHGPRLRIQTISGPTIKDGRCAADPIDYDGGEPAPRLDRPKDRPKPSNLAAGGQGLLF